MIKRLFDIVVSILALVILSPVIFIVSRKIAENLGKPVLFRQKRPGLQGDVFEMFKFRSMRDELDCDGDILPDQERLTPFGEKLRSSSLDELPGLWNVLKGDMSLVGPRPLLVEYLLLYSDEQSKRHNVRPGITGWAQVNGRNAISWEKKFELDVWYVENQSFWLDIKILFLTVKKVFVKDGISAEGEATMSKFSGSETTSGMRDSIMKKLAIFGGGGHGKVCASIAEELGFSVSFFDDAFPDVSSCGKWPVVGNKKDLMACQNDFEFAFIAIGNNQIRSLIQAKLESIGFTLANLISPTASIHKSVEMGRGILVVGNACINIDSVIEDGCIVNTNAAIDHDCRINSYSHVCPGVSLAGEVSVGVKSWIGIGSSVIQQISIGADVMVGAGTSVINNIPDNVTVVGCPGRIIKKKQSPTRLEN